MIENIIQPALSALTFGVLKVGTTAYNKFNLPVISTGRSFGFYRKMFFENQSESQVMNSLKGKVIADVGCGLTPYVSDSMFQACRREGVDFYGVDPKLAEGFKFGPFDKVKVRLVGGRGRINPDAKGLEKGLGTLADDLPFENDAVDLILSSYLLYAWIDDETILESIFREFHRVLKPGGQIKIFPTPHIDSLQIYNSGFADILSEFEIEQNFAGEFLRIAQYPPAYMTTFTKT